MFRRKSTWEKLTEPLSSGRPTAVAKSGLTAVGTFVGLSLASAAVSAIRQRKASE